MNESELKQEHNFFYEGPFETGTRFGDKNVALPADLGVVVLAFWLLTKEVSVSKWYPSITFVLPEVVHRGGQS